MSAETQTHTIDKKDSKPKIPKLPKVINISKETIKEVLSISETPAPVAAAAPAQELAKYQKLSDKEHILKKPDTYIGPIEMTEAETFVYDSTSSSIVQREIHYIPGLYKLFDEGAVNSRDHYVRQAQAINDSKPNALPVSCIEFDISKDGTITITNDGNGIDVAQHPDHKLWIPEMIFGHLRTSTNYDENKKEKIVGWKNGFGFKLVLIWSSWGQI